MSRNMDCQTPPNVAMKIRMATHDSDQPADSAHSVASAGLPPIIPPALPRRTSTGLQHRAVVITIACLAGIFCLLALLMVVAGFVFYQTHAPRPRPQSASTPTVVPTIQRAMPSEPGVTHRHEQVASEPWSIHVVKVDRTRQDLAFYAPLATGTVLGVNLISEQARDIPPGIGRALAGVNGDFYERDNATYAGDPRGLQIVNGELVSSTSTAAVWFDAQGQPHVGDVKGDFKITWPDRRQTPFALNQRRESDMVVLYTPTYGPSTRVSGGRDLILEKDGDGPWLPLQAGQTYRAKVRAVQASADTPLSPNALVLSLGSAQLASVPEVAPGTVLEISTATTPEMKGVQTAIAGGPALIKNGVPFVATALPAGATRAYSERSKYERHPRSAVGWNDTHLYLVTVDGRQPGLSVGMTLTELADYLVKLGCTDGMNFDGGASACMWMGGRVVNDPCQGERPVANTLFVIRKPDGR